MATILASGSLSSSEEKVLEDPEKDNLSLTPVNNHEDVERAEERITSNTALDWNGPNDPENPLNWSKWKRFYHVVPPAIISFTAYVSIF
jgi:hypothetical protein